MENPEIDPQLCSQLIFDKNVKSIQCGNGKWFLTNGARINGHPHGKEKRISIPSLYHIKKIILDDVRSKHEKL